MYGITYQRSVYMLVELICSRKEDTTIYVTHTYNKGKVTLIIP